MSNDKALPEVIEAVKAVYPAARIRYNSTPMFQVIDGIYGTVLSEWHLEVEAAWRDAYSRLPSSTPPAQDEEFEKWHDDRYPAPVYSSEIDEVQGFLRLEEEWQYMKGVRRKAWQAALASVLPAPKSDEQGGKQ